MSETELKVAVACGKKVVPGCGDTATVRRPAFASVWLVLVRTVLSARKPVLWLVSHSQPRVQ